MEQNKLCIFCKNQEGCRYWTSVYICSDCLKKHILKNLSDFIDIKDEYFDLVNTLHEQMDNIPDSVRDKIWDKVYARYCP